MRRLVLFDIDGTLLWTDGAGRAAIRAALVAEMGTAGPIDTYEFDGKTDPQIVRDLLLAASHPLAESRSHIAAVCERYVALLSEELERRKGAIRLLPGVARLLGEVEARPGTVLGLLTGNVERGAVLKLRAAGLDTRRFRVGAYGSDAAERAALPAIAVQRAAALMTPPPRAQEIVIIGDTPADVTCGNVVAARAIAVATGRYSEQALRAAGAFAAFPTLDDTAAVIDAIYA
jgi:phosphoglycolate phosphatase-like HAD superfamily hydrolase